MCAKSTFPLLSVIWLYHFRTWSYHGNSFPTFSFEKCPSCPKRNYLQSSRGAAFVLLCLSLHPLSTSDLGQQPWQWPGKWNSIQLSWLWAGLGCSPLSATPRRSPLPHLPLQCAGWVQWAGAKQILVIKHLDFFSFNYCPAAKEWSPQIWQIPSTTWGNFPRYPFAKSKSSKHKQPPATKQDWIYYIWPKDTGDNWNTVRVSQEEGWPWSSAWLLNECCLTHPSTGFLLCDAVFLPAPPFTF